MRVLHGFHRSDLCLSALCALYWDRRFGETVTFDRMPKSSGLERRDSHPRRGHSSPAKHHFALINLGSQDVHASLPNVQPSLTFVQKPFSRVQTQLRLGADAILGRTETIYAGAPTIIGGATAVFVGKIELQNFRLIKILP